ncbi:glycosyltransferase family 2 protein [Methylobacterium durans]|uniref:Glycosyltransferase family 2 protein n=1 Tax=Methylobacterium durans TaxID=2202825 RepID=A0A2U8WDB8_9HYPH|nr:glycosyltransferase family 2 protein [Methylobacterium durans]AWN43531.1 glycosyltransferase family 2 protein [Methylobacterium durans]
MDAPTQPDRALPVAVSCTIIAQNEADRIVRCIESVKGIAREIVVIDSGSTDETVALAERHGAVCHFNPWTGYGQQKRFAEDKARHDWVLNLDADEWLPEPVRAELIDLLSRPIPPEIHGFAFTISHVYPGHARPRPLADYHTYVRLYDKTRCRFPESSVFDEIKLAPEHRGRVRAPVYHQSIRSLGHLIAKNKAYFRLQAREVRKPRLPTLLRIFVEPVTTFLKYYLVRRHITGGVYGFLVASTIAGLRTYRLALFLKGRREP